MTELMYMSLYLKYRPKTIEQLDLDKVREAFGEIIKANKVAHAYLFTGPRGAGKTSSARIIARVVNCEKNRDKLTEPCNECASCQAILNGSSLDFIEIDAASNRGIDDIRELKEKIRLAPTDLRYKVYIIDEVHMLTSEAFNALLKTLEEPPAHTIFVLCTTETHKVPETIQSRCVHVAFSKASVAEMKRAFTRVVKGEGKSVSEDALDYLASNVDGSFRDGVKILDRVLAKTDKVELADMQEVVAGSSRLDLGVLVEALVAKDVTSALRELHNLTNQGVDLVYLVTEMMKKLRDQLLLEGELELTKLIFRLDEVARSIGTSPVPELLLQVLIIEWCGAVGEKKPDLSGGGGEAKQKTESKKEVIVSSPEREEKGVVAEIMGDHREIWQQLMSSLNGDSITLGALLSKATPARLAGNVLTISVAYGFHRDQIMTEKVRAKLEKLISSLVGREMRIVCEVSEGKKVDQPRQIVTEVQSDSDTIDEAMAIFS